MTIKLISDLDSLQEGDTKEMSVTIKGGEFDTVTWPVLMEKFLELLKAYGYYIDSNKLETWAKGEYNDF